MTALYLAGCILLFASASYMTLAPCYEDGILGKVWLILIAFGSGIVLAKAWEQHCAVPSPEAVIAIDGAALFILRHIYRFRRYAASRKDAL